MRKVLDPEGLYRNYSFERQTQNSPDVILTRHAPNERGDYAILGIEPYVELVAYAAQFKKYWCQEVRETNEPREITLQPNARPYPGKADLVADNPVSDRGRNFGRLARTGILDDYIGKALERDIRGIEARHWLAFFKRYGAQSVT